jgi:small conductance mechanosensitive channel
MKLPEKRLLRQLHRKITVGLFVAASFLPSQIIHSADAKSATYVASTIKDISIAPDELQWLVKPLTKEELIVEADAWRDLLKQKAREISVAEIAVKRQNEQIEKSQEAADAAEEAKDAAKEAEEAQQRAATQDGATATEQAAKVSKEASKKAAEAQKAVEAVKKAEADANEDEVTQTAQQVVKQVKEQKEETGETQPVAKATGEVAMVDLDTNKVVPPQQLESVVQVAKVKAETKTEQKSELLNTLTELRTQRAALIERFNIVLAELKAKGGEVESYEKYRDAVDEIIVDVSDTSAVWTFLTGWLTSEKGGVKWAVNLSKFFSILVLFYLLALLIGKAVQKATASAKTMSQLLKDFINTFTRRAIIAIGLLVAITTLGIAITPLLALITAAGLVIGLALQGTLSNFASGLLLLFYRPFDIGDAIDAGGTEGTVASMNLMSTIIRTWDYKVMIVPNNRIWGNVITNISRTERRRVDMVFGISYSDPIDKAQAILEKIAKEHPDTLEEPMPVVQVHELGDSSVNFVVRPWVLPANYWSVYWDITRKVKEEFDNQGISIPFPQQDVHLYPESEEAAPAKTSPESSKPDRRQSSRREGSRSIPKQNRLETEDDKDN